jgi:hypothetical protein
MVRAQEELDRVKALVDAGAAPALRLQEAQAALADAQDNELLRKGLAIQTSGDATEFDAAVWVAAAERRLARAQARVDRAESLARSGVASRAAADLLQEEVDRRRQVLRLVQERAQIIGEIAAMARAELNAAASDQTADDLLPSAIIERFAGSGTLSDAQIREVVLAYEKEFGRPLPISARGDTAIHRSMGFDHRGRIDVALPPNAREGEWLRRFLAARNIPYIAFRDAVPGAATGAHIHIGPPSLRLAAAD